MTDSHPQQPQPLSSIPLRLSIAQPGVPPSPPANSGESSSGFTRLSRYGSISTLATSSNQVETSEWYEDDHNSKLQQAQRKASAVSIEFEQQQVTLPVSQRPKGHYSLRDFSILRTLGTGSFGRVHLGLHCYSKSPDIGSLIAI